MFLERTYLPTTARFEGGLIFGFSTISLKNEVFVEEDSSIERHHIFLFHFAEPHLLNDGTFCVHHRMRSIEICMMGY